MRRPPLLRNNNGAVQVRVRLDRRDHFINRLEEELMKRTKMSKSGCYKQALLEYHARLTQSASIR